MHTQQNETKKDSPAILSDYLTRDGLARELGVTVRTLAQWHWARKGPSSIKIAGKRLYKRSDVEAWLNSLADGDK